MLLPLNRVKLRSQNREPPDTDLSHLRSQLASKASFYSERSAQAARQAEHLSLLKASDKEHEDNRRQRENLDKMLKVRERGNATPMFCRPHPLPTGKARTATATLAAVFDSLMASERAPAPQCCMIHINVRI